MYRSRQAQVNRALRVASLGVPAARVFRRSPNFEAILTIEDAI